MGCPGWSREQGKVRLKTEVSLESQAKELGRYLEMLGSTDVLTGPMASSELNLEKVS